MFKLKQLKSCNNFVIRHIGYEILLFFLIARSLVITVSLTPCTNSQSGVLLLVKPLAETINQKSQSITAWEMEVFASFPSNWKHIFCPIFSHHALATCSGIWLACCDVQSGLELIQSFAAHLYFFKTRVKLCMNTIYFFLLNEHQAQSIRAGSPVFDWGRVTKLVIHLSNAVFLKM